MGVGREWFGWLASDPGGAGGWASAWLHDARVASSLVIMAANVYVARVFYVLLRRGAGAWPARRLVVPSAGAVVLCWAWQLVLAAGDRTPVWLGTTALNVVAAGLWVAVALELPRVLARLSRPLPRPKATAPAPDEIARMASELAHAAQRVRDLNQTLQFLTGDRTGPHPQAGAAHEPRERCDDVETKTCKT